LRPLNPAVLWAGETQVLELEFPASTDHERHELPNWASESLHNAHSLNTCPSAWTIIPKSNIEYVNLNPTLKFNAGNLPVYNHPTDRWSSSDIIDATFMVSEDT
jgi:hypothetical protein